MDEYIQNSQEYALVKDDVPLISNLNIIENIALMQEVHHHKPAVEAEAEVLELLMRISLEEITQKRTSACNQFEIFCAMLIRAMLSDSTQIFIVTPFTLISTLVDIKEITNVINKLDIKKDIIILDVQNSRTNYEGDLCHIVK